MNVKKILLLIAFIAFIAGVSFALYWVFFRSVQPSSNDDLGFSGGIIPGVGEGIDIVEDPTGPSGLPWQEYDPEGKVSSVANGSLNKVSRLSDASVAGLKATTDGIKYYDQDKNQFFRINSQGEPELIR